MGECVYCGESTLNCIELGRGSTTFEIVCCDKCFKTIDALPQSRKDEMSEAGFVLDGIGGDLDDNDLETV